MTAGQGKPVLLLSALPGASAPTVTGEESIKPAKTLAANRLATGVLRSRVLDIPFNMVFIFLLIVMGDCLYRPSPGAKR
jgi:hypothetical protein